MVCVKDVVQAIENFASFSWSYEWDNPGLIAGSPDWNVSRVGVSLDATGAAISEAIERGCSCLVVHHPLIFEPLKSIQTQIPQCGKLLKALENRLAIVAAHTNWDVSPVGVNKILGDELGLIEQVPLEKAAEGSWGMGLRGYFPEAVSRDQLRNMLFKRWSLSWIRDYNLPKSLSIVAIAGGAGGDLWPAAISKGAEVFITADMKYHQIMDSVESGLGVIVADHGEMERLTLDHFKEILSRYLTVEIIHVDNGGFEPGVITIPDGQRGERE